MKILRVTFIFALCTLITLMLSSCGSATLSTAPQSSRKVSKVGTAFFETAKLNSSQPAKKSRDNQSYDTPSSSGGGKTRPGLLK